MENKVLGICGSLRSGSWNLKLLQSFLVEMEKEGFSTQRYPSLQMPLINEDLESKPLEDSILKFRSALKDAPIVVIASPEYNGSFSSALKNAIDWATRNENLWVGKKVILLAASPGAFGGVRGLIQLKTVLSGIRSWVLPDQVLCPFSDKAFSGAELINDSVKKQISQSIIALKNFL